MSGYTDREFAQKVDWEGGIFEAVFGYGLHSCALDNQDGDIAVYLRELEAVWAEQNVARIISDLEDALEAADMESEGSDGTDN